MFYGLKDRLNQYLHKKLNLPYCVKSVSGRKHISRSPTEGGWRIMKSSVGQEMRFAEYTRAYCSMSEMHFFY
ncbi:hypothetical protein DMI69_04500 [Escherichia coli]|nr:hypothetical protein [Escherichia coli]